MAADKHALRQQILAQIDHCAQIAYAAGHHFAQHGKHAPSSVMTKADADAKLVRLIEEYAACGVQGMGEAGPVVGSSGSDWQAVAEVVSWTNSSYGRNYRLRWIGEAPEGATLYVKRNAGVKGKS